VGNRLEGGNRSIVQLQLRDRDGGAAVGAVKIFWPRAMSHEMFDLRDDSEAHECTAAW
jgi:hypothetical protein